jgi:hypothetical protein
MNAFFDASPLNDGMTSGYEVIGREFKMQRNDGSGWFRAIEWDGDANIEKYALVAGDDDREYPLEQWGTDGPWRGHVDSLILRGTEIGEYALYYENRYTVEPGHAARTPQLFDRDNNIHLISWWDLPGFVHFTNAWRDYSVGFDVPFVVHVIPEPPSSMLLLIGTGGFVCRRRSTP